MYSFYVKIKNLAPAVARWDVIWRSNLGVPPSQSQNTDTIWRYDQWFNSPEDTVLFSDVEDIHNTGNFYIGMLDAAGVWISGGSTGTVTLVQGATYTIDRNGWTVSVEGGETPGEISWIKPVAIVGGLLALTAVIIAKTRR